jgi:hypothetical protein
MSEVWTKGRILALAPGAGQRFLVSMKRYANTPTLALPWRRR